MRAAAILALLLAPLVRAAPPIDEAALQTGDLVFQTSESAQAGAIREAQRGHPATHVGIIVRDGRGCRCSRPSGP